MLQITNLKKEKKKHSVQNRKMILTNIMHFKMNGIKIIDINLIAICCQCHLVAFKTFS